MKRDEFYHQSKSKKRLAGTIALSSIADEARAPRGNLWFKNASQIASSKRWRRRRKQKEEEEVEEDEKKLRHWMREGNANACSSWRRWNPPSTFLFCSGQHLRRSRARPTTPDIAHAVGEDAWVRELRETHGAPLRCASWPGGEPDANVRASESKRQKRERQRLGRCAVGTVENVSRIPFASTLRTTFGLPSSRCPSSGLALPPCVDAHVRATHSASTHATHRRYETRYWPNRNFQWLREDVSSYVYERSRTITPLSAVTCETQIFNTPDEMMLFVYPSPIRWPILLSNSSLLLQPPNHSVLTTKGGKQNFWLVLDQTYL